MEKKIIKYILLIIILFVFIFRPFLYRPSIYTSFNYNSREELFANKDFIIPIISQKLRNYPDFKSTPKFADKLLIKQFILFSLLIWCCYYVNFLQIDLRQRITRLIATYFNGSKYKDASLLIGF